MVEAEFDNIFFEELLSLKPKILIVDLYTDARFKTIPINNSYLTVNEWKTIKTKLYKDALCINSYSFLTKYKEAFGYIEKTIVL
jgi:hypothetical protein